jgi:multiple sugar transport system permease protein
LGILPPRRWNFCGSPHHRHVGLGQGRDGGVQDVGTHSTWIMKAFIERIPRELEEAAFVDGAGLRQILLRVILPLSANGVFAASVFVLVYSWNEYFFALIFTTRAAKTAPLVISEILSTVEGVDWGLLFAAATLQLLPIVVFVMAAQRYVVAGLAAGSVKG